MKKRNYCKRFVTIFCFLIFYSTQSFSSEWQKVEYNLDVGSSKPVLDRVNRLYFTYVNITNKSEKDLIGPFRIKIINPTLPVLNSEGSLDDSPYVSFFTDSLSPEQSINVKVEFALQRKKLSFTTEIYEQSILVTEVDGQTMTGRDLTDDKNNVISVLVAESAEPRAIQIEAGVANDTPNDLVTDGLIKVTNSKAESKQTILIIPSSQPKYVLIFNEDLQAYERVPFLKNGDGSLVFEAKQKTVKFGLVKE